MNATPLVGRLRSRLPVMLVLLAVLTGALTLAIVATRGRDAQLSQAQQVQQIAAGLHCPICEDLSVADSPAPLAQQMRAEIAQKLRAGESADQIRAGFVAAYGDSARTVSWCCPRASAPRSTRRGAVSRTRVR